MVLSPQFLKARECNIFLSTFIHSLIDKIYMHNIRESFSQKVFLQFLTTYFVAFFNPEGIFSNPGSGEKGLSIAGQTVAGNSPAKGSMMTKTDLLSIINCPVNCYGKNRSFSLHSFL